MFFQSENLVLDDIGSNCMLIINGKKAPTPDEYDQMLQLYRRIGPKLGSYKCLVLTDGASPTAQQRQQQQQEFGVHLKNVLTAVISDAITVRFVASSTALFVKTIRSFNQKECDQALTFLGVEVSEHPKILDRLRVIPVGNFKTLDNVLGR